MNIYLNLLQHKINIYNVATGNEILTNSFKFSRFTTFFSASTNANTSIGFSGGKNRHGRTNTFPQSFILNGEKTCRNDVLGQTNFKIRPQILG